LAHIALAAPFAHSLVHEDVHELAERITYEETADAPWLAHWAILDADPPSRRVAAGAERELLQNGKFLAAPSTVAG
jgi:hypothetical protein